MHWINLTVKAIAACQVPFVTVALIRAYHYISCFLAAQHALISSEELADRATLAVMAGWSAAAKHNVCIGYQ